MDTQKYHTLLPMFNELQGQRVVVRPYRESDAQALFDAVSESREHIRPWLPFADAHQTIEESRDWIIQQQAKILLRRDIALCLLDKTSGKFVGGTGLHIRDWNARSYEIGYWLRVSATGHGYVTEAVKLLTEYAFTHLVANRIMIRCDARNTHSAAVAQRLGFMLEGKLRNDRTDTSGNLRDTLVFSLIPGDKRKHYNKLTRDNTPNIIRQHGDTCQTEIMTESEFQMALREKIVEEAQEVMHATTHADTLKELADVYEVIDTLLDTNNISLDMLRTEQERRRTEGGGFTQRIKLLWTE